MVKLTSYLAAGAAFAVCAVSSPAMAQLNQTLQESENATAAERQSQERINALEEDRTDLFREYRATLQRIESQKLFVEQQRVYLRSQENEIEDLQRQIEEVDDVTISLLPMQLEMIDNLEEFIRLDVPFRLNERLNRVEALRELMDRPDVPSSEKYRKIVEAYEIEAEFGRKLTPWEGRFGDGPDAPLVDYLLIGRVAWVYMFKDESRLGVWDAEAGEWRDLGGAYRTDIRQAMRMANETATPNVFLAPVPGAIDAEAQ